MNSGANCSKHSYYSTLFISGLVPIYLYNGKRGVHLKYFFYVYYLFHLLILSLELVNQIIRDGGLFENTAWSSDTTSMLLVATDQKSFNFIYPDIFMSNGCFALLSTLSENGWELRQGDEIICTFSIDMDHLSDFYQKMEG